ncbi:hypothetical protein P8452_02982 [Trifolium repens]|nr:hypothetical protein P8452_02982 [Trifolium repens]
MRSLSRFLHRSHSPSPILNRKFLHLCSSLSVPIILNRKFLNRKFLNRKFISISISDSQSKVPLRISGVFEMSHSGLEAVSNTSGILGVRSP